MSPRNDTYLALCLAQAELSPLHYRHGSVIVRGGKVIGQGFNDYRPGFDGGALKTGTLARNALDGAAIAELKQRLKSKHEPDINPQSKNQQDSGSFTPFELTGSGHNSNACLSMHSEMMAIQSALSLSSSTLSGQTSARGAKYFEKPCFSLQSDSKRRKARARGLKAYAKAMCETVETGTGKSHVQEQGFEPNTSQPSIQGEERQQVRVGGGQQWVSRRGQGRGGEQFEKCRETPYDEVWVRGKVSVSAPETGLSSQGSTEVLRT